MNFLELAQKRQSVRSYKDTAVEREKIERCLEAARLAPSASNSQPWHFVVIDEPALKNQVAEKTFGRLVSFNHFTLQAPVLVAVLTEASKLIAKLGGSLNDKQYNHFDVGMATEHFCLQATEEGLGTCILGWFDEKAVKELLNLPKSKRIDLIITVGYPSKDEIRKKNRKPIDEIRSYNKYIAK